MSLWLGYWPAQVYSYLILALALQAENSSALNDTRIGSGCEVNLSDMVGMDIVEFYCSPR